MSAKKKPAGTGKEPRSYGRQSPEKTIKTFSLNRSLAKWADKQAEKEGISGSAFINRMLAEKSGIKLPGEQKAEE